MQSSTIDNHWVIISDETGMASVFPTLKERLAHDRLTAITLLYHSQNNQFIFQKELDILEWHFPTRLYVTYDSSPDTAVKQEAVEAVINANTVQVINFNISGVPAFTHAMRETLRFLGVNNIDIQEQFFSIL